MENYKKELKKSTIKYDILIIIFIIISFLLMLYSNIMQFLNIKINSINPALLVFASFTILLLVVVLVIIKNNSEHFFNAKYFLSRLNKVEQRVNKLEEKEGKNEYSKIYKKESTIK